jgi:hypothetical protein
MNQGTWEILVSWQHRLSTETTWENVEAFKKEYPDI